jgi:hypothetical protein
VEKSGHCPLTNKYMPFRQGDSLDTVTEKEDLRKVDEWEGFSITLVLVPHQPERVVEAVSFGGKTIWTLKGWHPEYDGLARLVEEDGEKIIALVFKGRLDFVIPVRDLPHVHLTAEGNYDGGRPLEAVIALKYSIAPKLGKMLILPPRERVLAEKIRRDNAAKRGAEAVRLREEEHRRQLLKATERGEKIAAIKQRPKLSVLTKLGHRNGLPVVDEEWRLLPGTTQCVSVVSYDQGSLTAGEAIEAFEVVGVGYSKKNRAAVIMPHQPVQPKVEEVPINPS